MSSGMQSTTGPSITFSTPGTYTIQVKAPDGGWQLDWMSFTRT